MISFTNVTFKYSGEKKALLNNLSFSLPDNKWIAIIGNNGSGKSTIIRLLDGLLMPQAGQIKIGNLLVDEKNIDNVHQEIGLVFQNPENQFVGSTVAEDIAFGLENRNVSPKEMPEIIREALHEVNMEGYSDRLLNDLSGGQKQRIAIAGLLAVKPHILVFDESTSMLDPIGRKKIIELLQQLHQQKKYTIITITHDLNEAELAENILAIDDGKILANGDKREVLANSQLIKQLRLIPATGQQIKDALKERGLVVEKEYQTTGEMVEWLKQKLNLKM